MKMERIRDMQGKVFLGKRRRANAFAFIIFGKSVPHLSWPQYTANRWG
jgi:hypothetical protein